MGASCTVSCTSLGRASRWLGELSLGLLTLSVGLTAGEQEAGGRSRGRSRGRRVSIIVSVPSHFDLFWRMFA